MSARDCPGEEAKVRVEGKGQGVARTCASEEGDEPLAVTMMAPIRAVLVSAAKPMDMVRVRVKPGASVQVCAGSGLRSGSGGRA